MKAWANAGAPNNKLILGIPFYGRSFTLDNPNDSNPGSSAMKAGEPGPYTDEAGFLAYYEICMQFSEDNGAKIMKDSGSNVYAVLGDQWVGYDTAGAIKRKVKTNKKSYTSMMSSFPKNVSHYLCISPMSAYLTTI